MIERLICEPLFLYLVMAFLNKDAEQSKRHFAKAKRTGPAINVIFGEKGNGKYWCGKHSTGEKELFNADFTLAISCPVFPSCAEDFFNRRSESTGVCIDWPNEDVVVKIRSLGCHVVPKPSVKKLVFYNKEQQKDSYLDQTAVLEWRYSFSQAEMILSDHVPDTARAAYVAFKATIKAHVNNKPDIHGNYHEISSYVLKTIFLYELESRAQPFWNDWTNIPEIIFISLFKKLRKGVKSRRINHYWIPSINLFQDLEEEDFKWFQRQLKTIKCDYARFVADDWLEYQRCIRLNCCQHCLVPEFQYNSVQSARTPCGSHVINCNYSENTTSMGPLIYNSEVFDVY